MGGGGHTVYDPDYSIFQLLRQQQLEKQRKIFLILKEKQKERLRLEQLERQNQRKILKQCQKKIRREQEKIKRMRQIQLRRLQQIRQKQKKQEQQLQKKNQQIRKKNQQRKKILQKPIIKTDPNQIKKIQATKKNISEKQKQIKQLLNPEKMSQNRENKIEIYLNHLQNKKWDQNLTNQYGILHNIVSGDISAGKTSSLNYFFGLNQKVGIDETTREAKIVKKSQKLCIWDSPGVNQDYDTFNIQTLQLFATANKVFLFFEKSLKCCKNNIRILAACRNNKNLYCIRTMCDNFQTEKQMKQALKKDYQNLKKWRINDIPVYGISSKKQIDFADNRKIKQLISN